MFGSVRELRGGLREFWGGGRGRGEFAGGLGGGGGGRRGRGRGGGGAAGDADAARRHPGAELVRGHVAAVLAHVEPPRRVVELGARLVGRRVVRVHHAGRRRGACDAAAALHVHAQQHLLDGQRAVVGLRQYPARNAELPGGRHQFARNRRNRGGLAGRHRGRRADRGGTGQRRQRESRGGQQRGGNRQHGRSHGAFPFANPSRV